MSCSPSYPKQNQAWWAAKLARNRDRDLETEQLLADAGWMLVVVWEHEDPAEAAESVAALVQSRRMT
jgi:DNA mismatch endonuclease (patch repair protein)